jgi:hypothetical protein
MPIVHNSVRNRAISKQPFFQNVRTCIKLMRTVIFSVALLVGRSRDRFPVVSLHFSVTYLLPTVPWPRGQLSPEWNWVPGTFLKVRAAGAWSWQPHHLRVPNVMKSGSLNFLESSGPHRACYGTPLPLLLSLVNVRELRNNMWQSIKNYALWYQLDSAYKVCDG